VIVVDTSALMALLLDEPGAETIADILANDADVSISAVTLAEARIVAARRGLAAEMNDLAEGLGFDVETATADTAKRVADAYAVWGKGIHPAALNFGDCFAYVTAMSRNAPLLYVGEDFARTDVQSAMARSTSD
jgi:ribonuclease VapC